MILLLTYTIQNDLTIAFFSYNHGYIVGKYLVFFNLSMNNNKINFKSFQKRLDKNYDNICAYKIRIYDHRVFYNTLAGMIYDFTKHDFYN